MGDKEEFKNYIVDKDEKIFIKLIDKYGAIGFISDMNGELKYCSPEDKYSVRGISSLGFKVNYNFFSYCLLKRYWYALYHIIKNYRDVTENYFYYEVDHEYISDNSGMFIDNFYCRRSMMAHIASEMLNIAIVKDDTNF